MNKDHRERNGGLGLVTGHVHDGSVRFGVPFLVMPERSKHRVKSGT